MAIDTKLNIDTSIKSRSDTITPNVRQDGGQMDRFMTRGLDMVHTNNMQLTPQINFYMTHN